MIEGEQYTHRFLASFHYARQVGTLRDALDAWFLPDRNLDLFIDSGAFTALMSGTPIDVNEYGRWLTPERHLVGTIANLDVIGNDRDSAEATWRNWLVLRDDHGLDTLPVVHLGEPLDYLDRYLDAGQDYIALGGLVGRSWKIALPWVLAAYRRVAGNAVFHGFGLTKHQALNDLPWYSVDSSSWLAGVIYGQVQLHDGARLRPFNVSDRNANANTSRTREFVRLARNHGFDPEALRNPVARLADPSSYADVIGVSVEAWSRVEVAQRRRHGIQHRPSQPDSHPGLKLYLANNQPTWFKSAHAYTPIHRRKATT